MEHVIFSPEDRKAYEKLNIPFCVCSVGRNDWSFLAVSDGMCRALQTTREALAGPARELLAAYVHPDDLARLRSDTDSACLTPNGQFAAVYRIRTGKDNIYRWVSVRGSVSGQAEGSRLLSVFFSDVHDEMELRREEAAARERQGILLSEILATTKTAIFWKNADRRFLGANKAFLDYYGFADESEILGKNDEEMGWHTEPDPYKNDELRVLHDGISTYRVPGRCIARGVNRYIVASKSPLIVDGRIAGLVGSFEDVTRETVQRQEISRLNEELQKQIESRDLLMSISEVCIIKVSLSDYTLLEYNDAMCRMIGIAPEKSEDLLHRRMEAFFTGSYRSELDSLKNTVAQAIAAGKRSIALNLRVPTASGFVWVGGSVSFTDYDAETNRPGTMYAVYRDISDAIEAQKKIELAEIEMQKSAMMETQLSRMRSMIDGVPSGIGALRITGGVPDHVMQLNRFFTERIDIAAGKDSVVDLAAFMGAVHPDERVQLDRDYREFLRVKKQSIHQYRFRTTGGDYVWISVRGTVARLSGNTEIAYFTYTNINEIKVAEARLRESRRFYRAVVQAAKLSTWEYDIGSRVIRMSEDPHTQSMMARLALGKVIADVPDSLLDLIDPGDRQAFLEMYRKVQQGQSASCEVWYKQMNGREPRCERITYIAVNAPDGSPDHAIGFSQNITAEKKVEERYQRELDYLRQTEDSSLGAKGHYNLTRNLVLEYTVKNDNFFGIRPGITYDEAFQAFVKLPYQEPERKEILGRLDRANLIARYQHGQMQTNLVYSRTRKGALPLWVSLNVHTYMSPETGDLEAFTYAYDVTGKMETDKIIGLISEVQFDFIGLMYAETDEFEFVKKTARVSYGNVRERFSYSQACEYVRGTFIADADRKQYLSAVAVENILTGLRENGGRHTTTYRRTENGRVLCKKVDYVWLDEPEKIVLVVRSDITASFERDQEQLARIEAAKLEADRANEAKSTFLSSMSHDLRTPLNGVLSFTAFALKENDPQKRQEYLEKIDASGKLLLNLVNDTLELSRIESGKAVLNEEVVKAEDLVPAVVTALRPSAELKGIRLISDLDSRADVPVWCDRLKCQKIALNLISNAIKYTPEGGTVSVGLKPLPTDVPGCRLSFIVEDNGIGMSEEFMQQMYEPFSQEKRSETIRVPGTGLGLSIVKHYVDLMGGKISVTSRLHEGTRWVVSLPIQKVRDGLAKKQETAENMGALDGHRVLLCEDNYMNTEIAVMLLKDRGIQVETAENGEAGLTIFAESAVGYFDWILMDIRMPVMDGFTATRKLRQLDRADAGSIPVIAMTADAFEESVREAEEAGMDGYVTKPIEPQKLYEALLTHERNVNPHE